MTKTEACERVARGAAFLDQKLPGWATRIDTGTLTLHDPCGCIVGQLFGSRRDSFHHALKQLGEPDSIQHGFEIDRLPRYVPMGPLRAPFYAELQSAWIDAIADRLAVPTVAEGTAVNAVARTDEVVAGGPRASRT